MTIKMQKLIKKMDLFARPISLTFNDGDYKYRTALGGITSMFVVLLLLTYTTMLVNTMINLKQYQTSSIEHSADHPINLKFKDTEMILTVQFLH